MTKLNKVLISLNIFALVMHTILFALGDKTRIWWMLISIVLIALLLFEKQE